jgi:hypothetical protein
MRSATLAGAVLALASIACRAPVGGDRRSAHPHAAVREIALQVQWSSIAHEPLVPAIAAELLEPPDRLVASCTPESVASFAASCELEARTTDRGQVAISLPPELGGVAHRRLVLATGGAAGRIEVTLRLAMAAGERSHVGAIELKRARPVPAGLALGSDRPPTVRVPLTAFPLGDFMVANDTDATLRWDDVRLEALPDHRSWSCAGCGNGSGEVAPIRPRERAHLRIGPPGRHLACTPPDGVDTHRIVVRLLGPPRPLKLPAAGWPVSAPTATEVPVYELAQALTLRPEGLRGRAIRGPNDVTPRPARPRSAPGPPP